MRSVNFLQTHSTRKFNSITLRILHTAHSPPQFQHEPPENKLTSTTKISKTTIPIHIRNPPP